MEKNMKNAVITLVVIAMLCGCTATMNTPFNEDTFFWSEQMGTSSILGQAFLKKSGNDKIYASGKTIRLLPVNDYTTELRNRVTIGGEQIGKSEPRLNRYIRTTVADMNGNFEFHNLPAGSWYLSTIIIWPEPSSYGYSVRGGIAYATVTIGEEETKNVIVTKPLEHE